MKKNAKFPKVVMALVILGVMGGLQMCYSDPGTEGSENTASGIALRSDAPIYTGAVDENDLEELTAEDFDQFGIESLIPVEQYRQYQKVLEKPSPGILIPYKMKIIDRDLAVDDFIGFDVPGRLSKARYDTYVNMNPENVDGHTIHYVFVYHTPLARIASESTENEDTFDSFDAE